MRGRDSVGDAGANSLLSRRKSESATPTLPDPILV
jgi:hypothetical protein